MLSPSLIGREGLVYRQDNIHRKNSHINLFHITTLAQLPQPTNIISHLIVYRKKPTVETSSSSLSSSSREPHIYILTLLMHKLSAVSQQAYYNFHILQSLHLARGHTFDVAISTSKVCMRSSFRDSSRSPLIKPLHTSYKSKDDRLLFT